MKNERFSLPKRIFTFLNMKRKIDKSEADEAHEQAAKEIRRNNLFLWI